MSTGRVNASRTTSVLGGGVDVVGGPAPASSTERLDGDSVTPGEDEPTPSEVTSNDLLRPSPSVPVDSELYETRLRRRLNFFFLNPYQKWKARRQFPYKLALQVGKIIFVTLQLVLFGSLRTDHINYLQQTRTTLRHVFIQNWAATLDVLVYPPAAGPFSVYTQEAFLDSLAFSARQYYDLDTIALTKFYRDDQGPELCFHKWSRAEVTEEADGGFVFAYDIAPNVSCEPLRPCKDLLTNDTDPTPAAERMKTCFGLLKHSWSELTDRLAYYQFTLKFDLSTVHVPPTSIADAVSCYRFACALVWEDGEQSGQITVKLETDAMEMGSGVCSGTLRPSNHPWMIFIEVLDLSVLIICASSFILCSRALLKGHMLRKHVDNYFRRVQGAELSAEERSRFVNLWYVMILINDSAISLGTMLKMSIDFDIWKYLAPVQWQRFNERVFTGTTVLLGVGTLLVWCGVLRYLGFFAHYNVLMQTMKRSAPAVLRFTVCAALLYFGFLLCGWIVLGPYSIKFKDVLSASECLFSLINGDDMFATFFTISDHNQAVKWFARVYLYVFISIFIYVVLSLFISIILSAYDVVKEQYSESGEAGPSELQRFIAASVDTPGGAEGGSDAVDSLWTALKEAFAGAYAKCCGTFQRRRRSQYEEIGVRLSDDENA